MAITIKDILDRNLFEGMTLVGGKGGIMNPLTWVNVMEILDTPDSIRQGELLVTTGYDLADYERQKHLISRLKAGGVSGIAIQVGYYIDRIPDFIIQAADEYDFPVLDLPAHFSFSEILRTIIGEINRDAENVARHSLDYNYFFRALKERMADSAAMFEGEESCCYSFALSPARSDSLTPELFTRGLERLSSFLLSQATEVVYEISPQRAQGVFLMHFASEARMFEVIYDLQIQLTFLSEAEGLAYYAGVSALESPSKLHESLRHCVECISLLNSIGAQRGVCPYQNYSFIQMLGSMYQSTRAYTMENSMLRALFEKDRTSNSGYVHTLRIYLAENCNATRTAARLFIHRHTLINRIHVITQNYGIDLDDYYTRLNLSFALLMHDYYAL